VPGRSPVALVLDADGLNAHAGEPEALAARTAPTVLTPHAGELGRLLGIESAQVGARRLHHAREAARRTGAVVVLKGDDTLVAAPDGRVAVSPGGAPGLATAGTGDVLSGICGALLAAGLEPLAAASAAVWIHLRAGQLAAEAHGPRGVIASDVLAAVPAAGAG
jgi:NAD(P)H-hydrate epimerase